MSLRTVLVVVLALVCGVTAAMGISALMRPNPVAAAPEPEVEKVDVVVAVADLGRFTTMTLDLVKVRMFAKDSVPTEAVSNVEDVLGRALLQPVVKGEAILDRKLGPKGFRGIEPAIPDGMRAVTIMTQNLAAAVAGFVLPGSKVDVMLTMSVASAPNDPAGGAKTFVLLENV